MQGNAIYARKEAGKIFFLIIFSIQSFVSNLMLSLLFSDGTVDYYTDKAPTPKPSPNTYTSSGHIPSSHTGMQITPPSPSHTHQYQGMYSVGGSNSSGSAGYPVKVEPPSSKKIAPTDLPDLPRYLQAKATLSTIMRDFTDNKVHFVGLDGHVISMAEFQSISKFTKTGEDPSKFMQGSSDTYKTGYNKKTNTFTENTLFVPLCVPYQTSSSSAAGSSSSVASSYNGTSVGSMRAY